MRSRQLGFAHIVLVGGAVLVLIGALVSVFVLRQLSAKDTQSNSQSTQTQSTSENTPETVEKVTEQPVSAPDDSSKTTDPVSAPAPVAAPAPVSTPAPTPQPTATPVTAANCSGGKFTVYVSNANGAPGSYYPPSSWQTVTTFAYGTSLQALCSSNASISPEYVIINDAYVKSSNLSTTKP